MLKHIVCDTKPQTHELVGAPQQPQMALAPREVGWAMPASLESKSLGVRCPNNCLAGELGVWNFAFSYSLSGSLVHLSPQWVQIHFHSPGQGWGRGRQEQ